MRKAFLPILLGLCCCSSCSDDVIVGVKPFRNMSCALSAPTRPVVAEQAIKFASRNGFQRRSNEFSTLLTTERLNFVLTYAPNAPIYVTGIARKAPKEAEVALFDQFIASLPLSCVPAQG